MATTKSTIKFQNKASTEAVRTQSKSTIDASKTDLNKSNGSVVDTNKLTTQTSNSNTKHKTSGNLTKFQQFRQANKEKFASKTDNLNDNQNQNDLIILSTKSSTNDLNRLVKNARVSGNLSITNFELTEIPSSVLRINVDKLNESSNDEEFRWWEQIDLQKLIIASNKIKEIPEEIQLLNTLLTLDVHDNEIEMVNDQIGVLSSLENLNLSHNQIKILPDSISKLKNLLVLNFAYNNLSTLPTNIGYLDYLEELNGSNNSLIDLPNSIGYLTKLRSLNLSANKIKTLIPEIFYSHSLRCVDLSDNQIEVVPKEIGALFNLEQLYLHKNRIKEMPVLEKCSQLKDLDISCNLIKEIQKGRINNLTSLVNLNLRENQLITVPEDINALIKLERLDVSNNKITNLPSELALLENLKNLTLSGNPLRNLRKDVLGRGTEAILQILKMHCKELNPKQNASNELSDLQIDVIKATKTFDFSARKATELPITCIELINENGANRLNISKNNIKTLPNEISNLSQLLTTFIYSYNNLLEVPSSLFTLRNLVSLDLRGNQLTQIQNDLSKLELLREIIIADNKFVEIPDTIYDLKNLEILFANYNRIQTINATRLLNLKRLSLLNLQNNNISQVPPELGNCSSLRSLQLEGNPFRLPRAQILAKGTPAILEYLRGRIAS